MRPALFVLLLLLGAPGISTLKAAPAGQVTVTSPGDSGAGSLRQALLDVPPGGTIAFDVPGGVITLTSAELVVDRNVTIAGPGAHLLTIERARRAAVQFRIFRITAGRVVTLQGLTISNGNQPDFTLAGSGGAIRNDHATLTVSGCVFAGNDATWRGGAIYNFGRNGNATVTVENCLFDRNSAANGGAIFNDASHGTATLQIRHSTFRGNFSNRPDTGAGGLMTMAETGGTAQCTISDSTFEANVATSAGAIYNRADGGGGPGSVGAATVTIANTTFTGNSAGTGQGGALYSNSQFGGIAQVTIANSTFRNNRAALGSSINTATFGSFSTITIGNTVFTTDSAVGNIHWFPGSTITSAGYNLCNDGGFGVFTATGDQIHTDAMLGPLRDNGGPTLTHAPLINSPAVDRGKRDTIPALTSKVDQRGFPRPINDPAVPDAKGGDGSDVGAVEIGVGVHPTGAVSQKAHGLVGTFPIQLPLTGPVGVECRSGGSNGDYQIVVDFEQPVTFSSASVVSGAGAVSSTSSSGKQATLHLTGVSDVQTITLALFDVDDGVNRGDLGVRMGVLVGDINGNRAVNASDVSIAKNESGVLATAENFRVDVNANGLITASDIGQVKANAGHTLP